MHKNSSTNQQEKMDVQDITLPNTLNPTYYETLFSVNCNQPVLGDLVMQTIADTIAEYGDGVEFLSGDMITITQDKIH